MKCLNCNEACHEPTAKFCHVCGHKLDDEVVRATNRTNVIPEFIAPVKLNGRWYLIDSEGRTVKELPFLDTDGYSNVLPFHDGYSRVRHNSKTGYIDKMGNEIIPTVYHGGSNFSEQRVAVFNVVIRAKLRNQNK